MEGQTDPELEVAFLLAVLRRYSALYGTLFELPGACAIARKHLSLQPEGARVTVLEGDFLKDPLPDHHDALILANRSLRSHGSPCGRQRNRGMLVYDWIGVGFLRRGWANLD